MFENKKNTTTASITFLDGFDAKKNDNNCHSLFWWFSCKEGDDSYVITYFYGGGVMKKVMATSYHRFFLFLWSFWSSSLKLKINNEMVVFLNVENWNG